MALDLRGELLWGYEESRDDSEIPKIPNEPERKKSIELFEMIKVAPKEINRRKSEKMGIMVKTLEFNDQEVVPLPMLVKEENTYKIVTQNETSKKIFLKENEDDPVIKPCDKFEIVEKKTLEKDEMEERFCHGEAMGQLNDVIDDDMLSRDKSLKAAIIKERNRI
jgi:hypothetical protein